MTTSMGHRLLASLLSIAALSLATTVATSATAGAASYHYSNCTALHKHFKHGVGTSHAKDHVSGRAKPVTNFKHSTKIYKAAVKFNANLDRDHDGVACEQH